MDGARQATRTLVYIEAFGIKELDTGPVYTQTREAIAMRVSGTATVNRLDFLSLSRSLALSLSRTLALALSLSRSLALSLSSLALSRALSLLLYMPYMYMYMKCYVYEVLCARAYVIIFYKKRIGI